MARRLHIDLAGYHPVINDCGFSCETWLSKNDFEEPGERVGDASMLLKAP